MVEHIYMLINVNIFPSKINVNICQQEFLCSNSFVEYEHHILTSARYAPSNSSLIKHFLLLGLDPV